MWSKKTIISFCCFVIFVAFSPPANSSEASTVSVSGSTGPTIKQIDRVEQTLHSGPAVIVFPLITLAPVASAKVQTLKEQQSLPTQIGFGRTVMQLSSTENTSQQFNWQKLPDNGYLAGIQIRSPEALALRIGMTVATLPENAEFRFFSINEGVAGKIHLVSARQILDTLRRNAEANADDPDGKFFWSPTVNGDTLGVEVYLPESEDPSSVQIAFPLISHITSLPFGSATIINSTQREGDSDPCQNDATCATNWVNLSNSVAGMQFSTSTGTFVCTGSLLNDIDPNTFTPYFISANHCISTQTVASSLETHWFYQSATCDGSTRSASYEHITGGSTLLHTQGMSAAAPTSNSMDTTLLLLNSAPPAGAYFAGWNTAVPPGTGTPRTGIHHPKADWKKISYGLFGGDWACGWATADGFGCDEGGGNFYHVQWKNGGTEGGSSGSAIYYNNDQVIGTLSGGDGVCAGSNSFYSSFRAAYAAGNYEQWLYTAPEVPVPVVAPMNFLLLR
jgi:lysyl endopeptidase